MKLVKRLYIYNMHIFNNEHT